MKLSKVPVNVGIRFHELGVMSHYYFVLPEDGGSQEISLAEIVSWFSGVFNSSHITSSVTCSQVLAPMNFLTSKWLRLILLL